MKKKMMYIIIIILLIIAGVIGAVLLINRSSDEVVQTLTEIENADYSLNELSDKYNEMFSDCEAVVENDNLIIDCDVKYVFEFYKEELTISSSDEEVYEVFKNVVLASQSFYYDNPEVLNDTINEFLNLNISVAGLKYSYTDEHNLTCVLSSQIEVYEPDYYFIDEQLITLMDSDYEIVYENEYITLNNGYLFYDENTDNLNFGGNFNYDESSVNIYIYIYDEENNLLSTFTDILEKEGDGYIQKNYNIENVSNASYIIIKTN